MDPQSGCKVLGFIFGEVCGWCLFRFFVGFSRVLFSLFSLFLLNVGRVFKGVLFRTTNLY